MPKKIISILISIILLFDIVYANEIDLVSERYILYNLNDNQVLMEEKENEEVSIASLTKIMTVIVAIENIKDFNSEITITNEMIDGIEKDVTIVGFNVGEVVTYDDLLYSSILSSGADAVNALAISIGGSIDNYLDLMNRKSEELNLNNTHYTNAIGLYDENNYSTAYDQAQLLIYALKNEKFRTIFETKEYELTNGKKIKSTIEYYNSKSKDDISYIKGSKTGYIKKAGYCLASIATLNNVDYLLITLNAFTRESNAHVKDHIMTYNYFNDNYGYKNIVENADVVISLDTKYSKQEKYNVYANKNINKYLKNDFNKNDVLLKYDGIKTISFFTNKKNPIGKVTVIYNDVVIDEFEVKYDGSLSFDIKSFLVINKIYILLSIIFLLFLVKVRIDKNKRLKIESSLQ